MFFARLFKRVGHEDPVVKQWLEKQSHPEDAVRYLIEKELYEYGERDLSYIIPRKRNDDYFAQLLDRESFENRNRSNLAMYDAISQVHPEEPEVHMPAPVPPTKAKTYKPASRNIEKVGNVPTRKASSGTLAGINKGKKIYHNTSSAVVFTAPEETYEEHNVDLTCFDD